MNPAGDLALQLHDQGWRDLIPILPPDASPNIRLADEKKQNVIAGRGKAPGKWSRNAGWSLLSGWRDGQGVPPLEEWASWPGVGVGMRACGSEPFVRFVDVDVTHAEAAAEIRAEVLRRADGGEKLFRIGQAPKFMIPVRVPQPATKLVTGLYEIDGQRHQVEILGLGQQSVLAGIHPKTLAPYAWPLGDLGEIEPADLPLVVDMHGLVDACRRILLRHGQPVGRKGSGARAAPAGETRPLHELRARDPDAARAAAAFVVNADWAYDDWVRWAYALRGAFGDDGNVLWLEFSAQSAKHDHTAAEKVWADATKAEKDGTLHSGAGTIRHEATEEGWVEPAAPAEPPHFDADDIDPDEATRQLQHAVRDFMVEARVWNTIGSGELPVHVIAGAVGLGKTVAALNEIKAVGASRFYAPTLDLAAEVETNAGDDGAMVRGRVGCGERWPDLCEKAPEAEALGRHGYNVTESLCRHEDEHGNVTTCPFIHRCGYFQQFADLEGKTVALSHEYLALPTPLLPKPDAIVIDERFHATLKREASLPLGRVTSPRPVKGNIVEAIAASLLPNAVKAMEAVEAGKTMIEAGISAEQLRAMARIEEKLADRPQITPAMPYAEQKRRAKQLETSEAFKLAKLWRTLADDAGRVTQRVVVARNIEWKGEIQDRVFFYTKAKLLLPEGVPVLMLDADHDELIGEMVLAATKRTVIRPRFNAEVIQVRDTACSKGRLLKNTADRAAILDLARREAFQGRTVLIGTYKKAADLLRQELAERPIPGVEVAHFGAIRGIDRWKDVDTVIVAGREQMRPHDAENAARALLTGDAEPLLLTGVYVKETRGYRMKDGSPAPGVEVQVHQDPRVQAIVEQERERGVEQMVGRLRPVHRKRPAQVILLSNTPTRLAVDRLTTWSEIMPSKLERAIVLGGGVMPLSAGELAEAFDLWPSREAAKKDLQRQAEKGGTHSNIDIYWNVSPLSAATEVTYRRPGQTRGSPHRAYVSGVVTDAEAARLTLVPVLGEVTAVRIVETLYRPGAKPAPPKRTNIADLFGGRPFEVIIGGRNDELAAIAARLLALDKPIVLKRLPSGATMTFHPPLSLHYASASA